MLEGDCYISASDEGMTSSCPDCKMQDPEEAADTSVNEKGGLSSMDEDESMPLEIIKQERRTLAIIKQNESDSNVPGLAPASDVSSSTVESDYHPIHRSPSHTTRRLSSFDLSTNHCSDANLSELSSYHNVNEETEDAALADKKDEKVAKSVSFGSVELKLYPLIPGDHPDCVQGPAMSIDWEPFHTLRYPVDFYEAHRPPRQRTEEALRVNGIDRMRRLRRNGSTDEELILAQRESRTVRLQRDRTLQRLKFQQLDLFTERVGKRIGRTFHPKVVVLKTKY